jgi:hypothetical protein
MGFKILNRDKVSYFRQEFLGRNRSASKSLSLKVSKKNSKTNSKYIVELGILISYYRIILSTQYISFENT